MKRWDSFLYATGNGGFAGTAGSRQYDDTMMIHALLVKVASLEKEAKATKESDAAEQGRW